MDLNHHISRSFDSRKPNITRSTVFNATYEQADISSMKSCPKQPALNINRNPIAVRSSHTFASTVFTPAPKKFPRVNIHRPSDHSTAYFYGAEPTDYYRKSKTSAYEPNFQPDYKYQPTWIIDTEDFLPVTEDSQERVYTQGNEIYKSPRPDGIYPIPTHNLTRTENSRSSLCVTPQPKKSKDIDKSLSPLRKPQYEKNTDKHEDNQRSTTPQPSNKTQSNRVHFSMDKELHSINNYEIQDNYKRYISPQPSKKLISPNTSPLEKKDPQYDPSDFMMREDKRCITPQPNKNSSSSINYSPSPIKPSLNMCLNVTGLKSEDSEISLRQICKGFHVVSLSTDMSKITGKKNGIAQIVVKPGQEDLSKLRCGLMEKGYKVSENVVSNGKKGKHPEMVNKNFMNTLTGGRSKSPINRHHTASEDFLSPISKKCGSRKNEPLKVSNVMKAYNHTKPKINQSLLTPVCKSAQGYMRGTASSLLRSKK
ncbi:hypothetical protein SteCoe_37832 [Stentor coeruleus]|uniref:Uncharacterized protein n=1 Tax=Stentor coeruleus TaxID=5963 RepID=A0A1R2AMA1_9CILI|nr:hypothetical protein SteCoe_37832 [Stentor coeruleus]